MQNIQKKLKKQWKVCYKMLNIVKNTTILYTNSRS